jgi:hypothetical protein
VGPKIREIDAVVDRVEFFRWEVGVLEDAAEVGAAGDDGSGLWEMLEDDAAAGGHLEVLMDVGALGDRCDWDAAGGEAEGGDGVRENPGAEEDRRAEVVVEPLEVAAERGGHEQVIGGVADLWEIGGAAPARVEGSVAGAGLENGAGPREGGAGGEDADVEFRGEGVKERGVIETAVGFGLCGEQVREK